MKKLAQVAESMQRVLIDEAEVAGKESGLVKRESKLTASLFVQTLVFGWLENPKSSFEQLSQTASTLGLKISAQGIEQRFSQEASECLRKVLHKAIKEVIVGDKVAIELLDRFNGIYIFDASTITLHKQLIHIWRGCSNQLGEDAALKMEVSLEYSTGKLDGPFLEQGRARDFSLQLQALTLPAGAIRLADLGYFSMDLFREYNKAGIYYLSRVQPIVGMTDEQGNHYQIADFLSQQKAEVKIIDTDIFLGSKDKVRTRLLAVRLPQEVAAQRRRKLYKEAKHRGKTPSEKQLAFTDWTVLITNVEADKMSLEEALVLAKVRWQIELLFKLWKSHGHIDESKSKKPWTIMTQVYAKLIGMIIQHWILITSCWHYPDRSLFKASQTIRSKVGALIMVFKSFYRTIEVLASIESCLSSGCRINKRKAKPSNFQLLLDPSILNYF